MDIKETDDHKDQRLELLMEAVGNDRLEGEACPNCFEQYSVPILRRLNVPFLLPRLMKGVEGDVVEEALSGLRGVKEHSALKRANTPGELVGEYVCGRCEHAYVGQLDLIANQAETRVLSFFGYDDSRIYERDFYTFSVLDDSYGPFVKDLWEDSVFTSFDPYSMENDIEDVITGKVLLQLEAFFKRFARVVYQDMGATVEIHTVSHAGKQEAGKGKGVTPTGADFAVWIGPLTKEDAALLDEYRKNPKAGKDTIPVRVGNGVIFQAKKEERGEIDRKQIDDLVHYASISHEDHDYFGIPGKLFMSYSKEPPHVTVLPCDYTYALYSGDLLEGQKTVSFQKTLKALPQYAARTQLPDFVQQYLSGKVGTPLLMLRDVFGFDGPKLVIGLPPEMLRTPSTTGGVLSNILGGWVSNLEESLEQIREEETVRAEAVRAEAERVEAARIEAERVEAERVEAERAEAARIDAERAWERLKQEQRRTAEQEEQARRRQQQQRVVVRQKMRNG